MARSKFKRKGTGQKHVQLFDYMLRSAAWRDLSTVEMALYVEIKRRFDGFNNGRIGMSCREAAALLNVSKATAGRAFDRLQRNGLITIGKPSGFNVKGRVSTEWRLTEYRCDVSGELPTKEFLKWKPDEKTTVSPEGQTVSPEGQFAPRKAANHA